MVTKGRGVAGDLRKLQKAWEHAEAPEGNFYTPPEGTHQAVLGRPEVEYSKNGRLQVRWPIEGIAGKVKGKEWLKFDGLENETNLSFVKASLLRLGIKTPSKFENLQKALDQVDGLTVEIFVKVTEKDDNVYTNTYFNRVIQVDSDEDEDEEEDEDVDEEEEDEDEEVEEDDEAEEDEEEEDDEDSEEEDEDEEEEAEDEEEEDEEEEEPEPPKKKRSAKKKVADEDDDF